MKKVTAVYMVSIAIPSPRLRLEPSTNHMKYWTRRGNSSGEKIGKIRSKRLSANQGISADPSSPCMRTRNQMKIGDR